MVIFHSYVKLPEGNHWREPLTCSMHIQVGLSENGDSPIPVNRSAGFFNCKFGVYPMFEQSQMKDPVKSPYLMVSSVRDMKIIYKYSHQLSKKSCNMDQ